MEEDCKELNLFSYANKKGTYTIEEIADKDGWKLVKNDLMNSIGSNGIPRIYINEVCDGNILELRHDHDGRDLDLAHADEVVVHVSQLWDDIAKLDTIIEDEPWEI